MENDSLFDMKRHDTTMTYYETTETIPRSQVPGRHCIIIYNDICPFQSGPIHAHLSRPLALISAMPELHYFFFLYSPLAFIIITCCCLDISRIVRVFLLLALMTGIYICWIDLISGYSSCAKSSTYVINASKVVVLRFEHLYKFATFALKQGRLDNCAIVVWLRLTHSTKRRKRSWEYFNINSARRRLISALLFLHSTTSIATDNLLTSLIQSSFSASLFSTGACILVQLAGPA